MKKLYIFTSIICCFLFQISKAQELSGIATYKSFLKFDLKLDSTKMSKESMARTEQILKQQTQKEYELHFNKKEAVFKLKNKLETPGSSLYGNTMVTSTGGFGVSYENLKENRSIIQRDLYGKLFLITDTLKEQDWKLEKETKNIGDYTCFKATRTRISENEEAGEKKEIPVVAWYTPQIPIAFGPEMYGGLPGLILEISDGDFSYLCNQIILNPKNGVEVEEPSKGKKVSRMEFDKIQTEKNREVQERDNFPGSHTIQIHIGGY